MSWEEIDNYDAKLNGGGGRNGTNKPASKGGEPSGQFGTLPTGDVNKLRGAGLSDETIAKTWRQFATDNGGLDEGWEGLAAQLAKGDTNAATMEMFEGLMGLQIEGAKGLAQLNFELTQEGIERNLARYPLISEVGLKRTKEQVVDLNDLIQSEYEATLDEYYPEWRTDILGAAGEAQADSIDVTKRFKENILPAAMASADRMSMQALSNTEALLRGDIPEDVAAQLKRHAAEVANQIGVRGQAAQYLTARDLGKTSLDLQQQGLANAPAALALGANAYLGFNQALQAPVKTGMDATNLVQAYLPKQADPASVFSSNLSLLSGASIIPASSLMSTMGQVATSGAQLAGNAYTSMLEYNSQQYWNQQNLNMQQKALRAQESANKMNFVGSLLNAGGDAAAAYFAS